nr:hypothetical protein B0A51_03467 [Rachicladosporium sp. CCFEE 5018]
MADLAIPSIAALTGVAAHALYFHGTEHHFYGLTYLSTFLFTCIGSIVGLKGYYDLSITAAISRTTLGATWFLAGLFASLAVYRLFLNPLNKFPGPTGVRLSSFAWSGRLTRSDAYLKLKALHDKHGKVVRIGSHDLSIVDPEGMQISYGPQAKATKGPWYDGDAPLTSMHTSRSKALHDKRRRVWAPAFSDKALREYELQIDKFNDKLVDRFREFQGQPVEVGKWFNLYSFDVMGKLAFGKDYHMLDNGVRHWALDLLSAGMEPMAIMPPTWFFRILATIPGLAAGYFRFVQFCVDETKARIHADGKGEASGDITGWILKAYKDVPQSKIENDTFLHADVRLLIVAGSDTTAATLVALFYHLAQMPALVESLREELRPVTQGQWTDKDINHLPLLNGAINEALRLHPPVPSGVQRKTPKEGMMIGETYIPGNVNFWMPQYVMGRDEAIYPSAESFIPERWSSKPELIKHKDAFAPFSMGPFGCIGKNMAYIELRTLTARLLLEFNVAFAPGEDGTRFLTQTKDHFTVDMGAVDLVFTPLKA